jgi:hypothetical protein
VVLFFKQQFDLVVAAGIVAVYHLEPWHIIGVPSVYWQPTAQRISTIGL